MHSPKIDFRFDPNNGHSEAHAGLPLVTHSGHFSTDRSIQISANELGRCPWNVRIEP